MNNTDTLQLFYIVLSWSIYFATHSILASNNMKIFVESKAPKLFKYYRLIYNLSASIGLITVYYIYKSSPINYMFFEPNTLIKYSGLAISFTGIIVTVLSFRGYRLGEFIGTETLNLKTITPELNTQGLNKFVRHPIYFGSLLMFWGYWMSSGHVTLFAVAVTATLYIYIGTKLEENKLILTFDKQYIEYKKRVKMLIPYIF